MSCKLFRILLVQPIYYQQQTTHLKFDLCLLLLCCVALLLPLAARVAQRRAYHQHEWGAVYVCAFGYCMRVHICAAPETRWIMSDAHRSLTVEIIHSLAHLGSKNTYSANRFHIYSGGGSNFKTRRNKMVRIDGAYLYTRVQKKVDCRSDGTRWWCSQAIDQTTASLNLFSASLCSCRFFKTIKRLLQATPFFTIF